MSPHPRTNTRHLNIEANAPIIYPDFDGTLHREGTPVMDEYGKAHPEWPGVFCWLPLLEHALRPYLSTRIIISSSWRFFHDDADLQRFLGPLGNRFAGVTPDEHDDWTRVDEILRHSTQCGHNRFLALDDDRSVKTQEHKKGDRRFMWCSSKVGISSQSFLVRLRDRLRELHADNETAPK